MAFSQRALFLFCICIVSVLSVSDEILQQASSKLDEVLEKSKSAAKPGLIDISGSDFEKFISRGPRPYYCMVILTALSSGNCQPCEALNPSIEELGQIIEEQRHKIDRESPLFTSGATDVFIFNADFSNNRNVFQKLGLSTAPTLVMVPPTKSKKEIQLSKFFKSIPTKYQYSLTTGRSAEEIGNWIATTAKADNWLTFGSKLELPPMQYIVAVIVIAPVLIYLARHWIDITRKSMLIYALVSMVAYSFIIGGGMFSSIRSTPWLHKDGNKVAYISHQSRYQFGVETYIVGALNFLAGFGAWVFIMAQRSDQVQVKGSKYFRWFKFVPTFVPLIAVVVGWYGIMWCYNFKNGHYNMGHVGMKG